MVLTETDGRRERTGVTRQRILDATRDLILEGDAEPTAKAIASRVGMTTRTLFRHFPDMESLHREIIRAAQADVQAVLDEPFPSDADTEEGWQARIHIIVDRRVRAYEYVLPLQISSLLQRYRSAATEQDMKKSIARRRRRLKEVLPKDLAADPLFYEALDGILSIEYWISLRRDQRLSVTRATDVLHHAVSRMIGE